MKISHKSITMAVALSKLVADRKSTLPALGMIRMEAKGGHLAVRAFDLETDLLLTLPCEGELAPVLLSPHKLAEVLKAPGGKKGTPASVEFQSGTGRVSIGVGTRSFDLRPALPVEEFPEEVRIEAAEVVANAAYADVPGLVAALEYLLPAVSTDVTRPAIGGVRFEGTRGIATDGHRLHLVRNLPPFVQGEAARPDKGGCTVPRASLATLLRVFKAVAPGVVAAHRTGSQIAYLMSGGEGIFVRLTAKMNGSRFPDYEQIIPRESETRVTIAREALNDGAAIMAKFASGGLSTGTLDLVGEDTLSLTARDPDAGDCSERIPCRTEGPGLRIGISLPYLQDALAGLGESVTLGFSDDLSPILVENAGQDASRLAVVMPVRI